MENETKSLTANNLLDVRQSFDSKSLITNITEQVINGNVNPLEAHVILKRMAKVSEEVLKNETIKKMALTEAEKYLSGSKKTFEQYSSKITIQSVYTYYEFEECGHEVLDELYKIQELIKEQIKVLEEGLKTIIPSEKAQANAGLFGIENNAKEIVMEKFPKLIWEDYGNIVQVQPPRKIQNIGLKMSV